MDSHGELGDEDIEPGNEQGRSETSNPQSPPNHSDNPAPISGINRDERTALFAAALKGDWKAAERIMKENPSYVNSIVTEHRETSLHIAAGAKRTDFVKKLVNRMQADFGLTDKTGNTAFCNAVMAGSVPVAKFLLEKDPDLAFIRGGQRSIPLFIAVLFGHHDMARFLFKETKGDPDRLKPADRKEIFITSVQNDMFDIALGLLESYMLPDNDKETALHLLARKPSAFDSKRSAIAMMLRNLCNYGEPNDNGAPKLVQKILETYRGTESLPGDILFNAAELGNYKFLALLIQKNPELIWKTDGESQTIFHIAARHRQGNIFNQIYSLGLIKDVLVSYEVAYKIKDNDYSGNILHLTAMSPSLHELNNVSGSAFQMQQELMWFEEVKSILIPSDREKKGSQGWTPRQLFSEEHRELLEKAEKWMRDTSTSCLIVATIITTVVYSAGFSIPGGYNESPSGSNATTGSPVHINHTFFHVFVVSEAIALSFSVTSTLIFLFILTSRYAQENFLKLLPVSLMCGLATLFISIMAMVVSFSSAFFLAYRESYNQNKLRWVPIVVTGLALLPASCFCFLQYPLLCDILNSTCCRSLFRRKKPLFI